jgi:hypothetical protein
MSKQKSPQDEKLQKNIADLVKSYESGRSTGTLGRLGEFLSTAVTGPSHTPDFRCTPDVDDVAHVASRAVSALGILITILRLIFRF